MGRMGLANQLLAPRLQKIRRTKVTNQRTRKHHVEDTVEDVGDIAVDTVYPKEGKVAKESMTRNHLTRRMIPSPSLSLSPSPRTTPRIALVTINVPFAGRRATTRQTVDSTRGTSQCA